MKYIVFILLLVSTNGIAQNLNTVLPGEMARSNYFYALDELKAMLQEQTEVSFKKAVFTVENAYLDNLHHYEVFNSQLQPYVEMVNYIMKTQELLYDYPDKEQVKVFGAIYKALMDTTYYVSDDQLIAHAPFKYDFEDFWGEQDWTKMFVSKLLSTGTGNCHSLPFLYKILAEEMGKTAYLAMAPNHTYIKLWTEKTGWFNTELTSSTFPVDAWIMASGYVHLNAVQNGIYMDTLSLKQSIAVTVTDLASGYEKKFGKTENPEFVLECLDVTLEYYPNYINALLMKAETQKVIFERMMKDYNTKVPSEILEYPECKAHFDSMEQLYFKIHNLGYRKMPKQMYLNWLADLQEHKDKYVNKDIIGNLSTEKK